jgi:ubiquinone/menaquinone biosynthesis C-methylase UbiE
MSRSIKLPFSDKYDEQHSQQYLTKHKQGLWRRMSHQRDIAIGRKALERAGNPQSVLDLPCGAGRFWPMLAEQPGRRIIAADNSSDMLATARKAQPTDVVARVTTMQTSVFAIDLADKAVDSVFCMRLLHHIGSAEHRMAMLSELHRVSRDSVIVSLWVDGNFKSWRRKRLERKRDQDPSWKAQQNRFVLPAITAEAEFRAAGFTVQDKLDFLPGYAMWRVYVLRKR